MIRLTEALKSLRPDAEFVWVGHDYAGLIWHDSSNPPTEAEIETECVRLQAEYEANEYQRQRAAAYPGLDQLVVAMWESIVEGRGSAVADIQALREAVKSAFPKP
jgi:hypothetical protein